MNISLLLIIQAAAVLADTPLPTPNAIHNAEEYTSQLASVENGILYEVRAPVLSTHPHLRRNNK